MKYIPLVEDDFPPMAAKNSVASMESGHLFDGAHEILSVGEVDQPWSLFGMSA